MAFSQREISKAECRFLAPQTVTGCCCRSSPGGRSSSGRAHGVLPPKSSKEGKRLSADASSPGGGERRLRPQDLVEQRSPLPRWWPVVRAPPCLPGTVSDPQALCGLSYPPLLSSVVVSRWLVRSAGGKAGNAGWLRMEAERSAET